MNDFQKRFSLVRADSLGSAFVVVVVVRSHLRADHLFMYICIRVKCNLRDSGRTVTVAIPEVVAAAHDVGTESPGSDVRKARRACSRRVVIFLDARRRRRNTDNAIIAFQEYAIK